VPLVGVAMFVFAIANASIEGVHVGSVIVSLSGLGLVCYRLWSPWLRRRAFGFELILALLLTALGLQIVPFARDWFEDQSVPGLVLDSVSVLLVAIMRFVKLSGFLRNPSPFPFWKVSQTVRVFIYLIGLGLASVFNPCLLTCPYILAVLVSLHQLRQGKEILVGGKSFPVTFLGFTFVYFLISIVACLPVVKDQVKAVVWLAQLLGVPETYDSADDYYNYSCVMPAGISLFVLACISPWWADISATASSKRLAASSVGSSVEDNENFDSEEKRGKNIIIFIKTALSRVIFPSGLLLVPLLLPSTMSVVLLLGGFGLFAYPAGREKIVKS
jgi:hypothetical protein